MFQLDSNATIKQSQKWWHSARTVHAHTRTSTHQPMCVPRTARTMHAPCTHRARTIHVHARTTRTQHGHERTHTHIILCVPRTPLTQFMYGGVVKTSARRHTAPFAEVFSISGTCAWSYTRASVGGRSPKILLLLQTTTLCSPAWCVLFISLDDILLIYTANINSGVFQIHVSLF